MSTNSESKQAPDVDIIPASFARLLAKNRKREEGRRVFAPQPGREEKPLRFCQWDMDSRGRWPYPSGIG